LQASRNAASPRTVSPSAARILSVKDMGLFR
jgi:hypothetical protein